MATIEELRAAALQYAAAGIRVFPVLAGRKEPATAHGVKDATTDPSTIEAWWSSTPYLIGIACGPGSGVFVIDNDPRNGGAWESPVSTASVRTGGRYDGVEPGMHYYFKWPVGVAKMRPSLAPGVDVQGAGKYVIAPPSVTQDAYEWTNLIAPVDCPPEILAEIAIPDGALTDTRPGDRFNARYSWAQVLEPYGWSVDHEGADGETYWTRPGKDEGVSATTNYSGSDLFYVFSTSTEFESERGYDKFGVFAVLEHGGDIAAAASSLAEEMPRLSGAVASTPPPVPVVLFALAPPSPAAALPGHTPAGYAFAPALGPEHMVARFIEYVGAVCDAPSEYAEAAALSLLATVTSGMRISLAHIPDGLRTNLYLALVGPSSIARKSTVQQIATSFLRQLRPNSLLPDRFASTESAIAELGQRSVALWTPDELGIALQQIYQSDLKRGLEELLLTLYGGQTYRYVTLARGEETVSNLDLSVLGAATPDSFASISGRAMGSGLLPRFGLVYPRVLPTPRSPVSPSPEIDALRAGLLADLRNVLTLSSTPGAPRIVTIQADALAVLGGVDAEFGAAPMTARLVTATYKVAALLALASLRTEIQSADASAAVIITRRWAEGAHNMRRFFGRNPADLAAMEQVDAAREELRNIATGRIPVNGRVVLSSREVAQRFRLPAQRIKQIRDTLEATGEVLLVQSETGTDWHVQV